MKCDSRSFAHICALAHETADILRSDRDGEPTLRIRPTLQRNPHRHRKRVWLWFSLPLEPAFVKNKKQIQKNRRSTVTYKESYRPEKKLHWSEGKPAISLIKGVSCFYLNKWPPTLDQLLFIDRIQAAHHRTETSSIWMMYKYWHGLISLGLSKSSAKVCPPLHTCALSPQKRALK